ncbi:MAG: FkbM family methyltransferase [Chloroflexi bacterium]|nr:FkbM family methyltransferase [Chloroflexota bacterium]
MSRVGLYGLIAGRLPRPLVSRIYAMPRSTRVIRAALNLVLPEQLQEAEVVAGPLRGARLLIYPRHEASFVSGLWEFWLQDALVECLRPGDIAWDVGAYIGYFSLLMRRRSCSVLALEPDPDNRRRLERILEMNGATDVRVLPVAALEEVGAVRLGRIWTSPSAAAIDDAGEVVAPATTLDAICAEFGPPRLVKLDVEGAEAEVLVGASRLLHEVRPLWLVELHGEGGRQAAALLRGAGYRLRTLNRREGATHQEHILAYPPFSV